MSVRLLLQEIVPTSVLTCSLIVFMGLLLVIEYYLTVTVLDLLVPEIPTAHAPRNLLLSVLAGVGSLHLARPCERRVSQARSQRQALNRMIHPASGAIQNEEFLLRAAGEPPASSGTLLRPVAAGDATKADHLLRPVD